MDRKNELIKYLSAASPEKVLSDLGNGNETVPADIRSINRLREMGLKEEVINVLLHFSVMTGMGLKFSYLESTAKWWLSNDISTIEEAMKRSQRDHQFTIEQKKKLEQKKELKDSQASSDIKSIKSAISTGLTNEQLGKFVRSLMSGQQHN